MKFLQVLISSIALSAIVGCTSLPVDSASVESRVQDSYVDQLVAKFEADYAKGMPLAFRLGGIQGQDRFVRDLIIEVFQNETMSQNQRAEFIDRTSWMFDETDEATTLGLKKILETSSWDELVLLSPRFVDAAFHIVQHSNDKLFRLETLPELKRLAEAGKIDQQKYALMYDRSTLEQGGMQIYGTQMRCQEGERRLLKPHADIAEIKKNRLDLNMEPYEVYKKRDEELYGACSS